MKFTAKAYEKYIQHKMVNVLSDVLEEDVAPVAKEVMHKTIQEKAYDSYEPRMYQRRGVNDGLLDYSNIITYPNGLYLTVRNVTRPNKSIVGQQFTTSDPSLFAWLDQGLTVHLPGVRYKPWVKLKMGMLNDMYTEMMEIQMKDILNKSLKKRIKEG